MWLLKVRALYITQLESATELTEVPRCSIIYIFPTSSLWMSIVVIQEPLICGPKVYCCKSCFLGLKPYSFSSFAWTFIFITFVISYILYRTIRVIHHRISWWYIRKTSISNIYCTEGLRNPTGNEGVVQSHGTSVGNFHHRVDYRWTSPTKTGLCRRRWETNSSDLYRWGILADGLVHLLHELSRMMC